MSYMGREHKMSGYMYMHNWFTLLYTWNEHNLVYQLHSNKNLKNKGKQNFKKTEWIYFQTEIFQITFDKVYIVPDSNHISRASNQEKGKTVIWL